MVETVFPDGTYLSGYIKKDGSVAMTGAFDAGGFKIYLYKAATDAASMYIMRDSTSGNMIFHVPAGESVEWQVG